MDLVRDELAGDPMTDQRWVRRSLRKLQRALARRGVRLSHKTVRRILLAHKIRPRSNDRHLTPRPHPDRDKQFSYLMRQRRRFERQGLPVLSVDTKKKELIGPFRQAGQAWSEQAIEVYSHDFPSDAVAKAVPYGLYDVQRNQGYVYVGLSSDTPDFAVDAIARWWAAEGRRHDPEAKPLLILADGGGSNGYRPARWKWRLQTCLANAFGLTVTVSHFPPGASKWNPIEHRLFSQISQTWRGLPLTSLDLMLAAIRATTTITGLRVKATQVRGLYLPHLRVPKATWTSIRIQRARVCPLWNYTIRLFQNGKLLFPSP